jgi:tetratricopeptide (TPR) repeat protein
LIAKYPETKSVRSLASLADYHRRAGHIEAAKATLKEAMKLDPGDGESQLSLVRQLRQLGQIEEAIQVLRSANKKEPNNPMYELTLADVLSKIDHNDEAIKILEDMLKRYGDNDQVVTAVRQNLSVIYVSRGDFGKVEAQLELLLARNPDDPLPNNDLGYLYAEQGKNLEKAESMIRKALQEEPDSFAYLDSLGWVLFKKGKVKEALEPLKKAMEQMKLDVERRGAGAPTPRSSSTWATCIFSSSSLTMRVMPGGRRRKRPRRPSHPTSDYPRFARRSNRWKNWALYPSRRWTEHRERRSITREPRWQDILTQPTLPIAKGWSMPSERSFSPSSAARSTWPRATVEATRPQTCGCATRSTRPARSASQRRTSSARSRRAQASSAARTLKK